MLSKLPANIHLTNRFQVAVRLFSHRSQMTSKCGKNKKVALEAQPSVSLMFLLIQQATEIKPKENSQVARFANLSEDQLQQILAKRHSLGTKKDDQLVINNFRGKISAFIVVTLGIYQNQKNHNYTLSQ